MFHSTCSRTTPSDRSTSPSPRDRRLCAGILLQVLVLALGLGALGTEELRAQSSQEPSYAWTLKSGLFTSESDEIVRVLLTNITESTAGIVVAVRFFDRESNLLKEIDGVALSDAPLVAEFSNESGGRMLLRIEIDLLSTDSKAIPVTTLEVDRPDGFAALQKFSCAGPMVRQPVEFSCADDQDCTPPAAEGTFHCPELVSVNKVF